MNPFGNMMQQMQKMTEEFQKKQQELNNITVIGEAGAGLVKITCNGNGDTLKVAIDDAVYQDNKQVLQDLLVAAANDVKTKLERCKKDNLQKMLLSMGLPANMNFPFMPF